MLIAWLENSSRKMPEMALADLEGFYRDAKNITTKMKPSRNALVAMS